MSSSGQAYTLAFKCVPMFGIVTKSYRKRSICVPGASTGSTIGESAAVVIYAAKYAIGHSTDGYTLSAAGGYATSDAAGYLYMYLSLSVTGSP